MNRILIGLFALGLTSCVNIEDFFLSGGQTENEGSYTFEYDGTNEMLSDESMFFMEDERTLVELSTTDDQGNPATTFALYLGDPTTISTDTVIIYCYGNGGNLERALYRASVVGNVGGHANYGILIPEYLGFGLADGEVSEENQSIGVDAGMKWLEEQGLTEDRLFIYGVSLGSAAAVNMSAYPRTLEPQKTMLEAPIAGIATLAQDVVGVNLGISFFSSGNSLDNLDRIGDIDQPVLLMHGTRDDYIDYESNGLALVDAYQGESMTLVPVEGATHVNVPEVMGFDLFEETILSFLRGN